MSDKPIPKQLQGDEVSCKVGEECLYWAKFGEYVQQQAIQEGWLDAQGRLTKEGFQVILSEEEGNKKRSDLVSAILATGHGSKGKAVSGNMKINGSKRKSFFSKRSSVRKTKAPSSHKGVSGSNKGVAEFLRKAKILLAKINGELVYFGGEGENLHLVIRIPSENSHGTSHTLRGTFMDIKQEFGGIIDQYD